MTPTISKLTIILADLHKTRLRVNIASVLGAKVCQPSFSDKQYTEQITEFCVVKVLSVCQQ